MRTLTILGLFITLLSAWVYVYFVCMDFSFYQVYFDELTTPVYDIVTGQCENCDYLAGRRPDSRLPVLNRLVHNWTKTIGEMLDIIYLSFLLMMVYVIRREGLDFNGVIQVLLLLISIAIYLNIPDFD